MLCFIVHQHTLYILWVLCMYLMNLPTNPVEEPCIRVPWPCHQMPSSSTLSSENLPPFPSRRFAESIGRRDDDADSKRREEQQVHSPTGAGDHQFWGCSLTCSCSTSSGWGGHTQEHDRSNAAVFLSLHCATLHSRFEYPEISYISDIFLFKFSGICFELLRETNQIIAQIKPDCNKGILG